MGLIRGALKLRLSHLFAHAAYFTHSTFLLTIFYSREQYFCIEIFSSIGLNLTRGVLIRKTLTDSCAPYSNIEESTPDIFIF